MTIEKDKDNHINANHSANADYLVYVFAKGLLLTKPIQLPECLVIPFRGLDAKDNIELVSEFFSENTNLNVEIKYSKELQHEARVDNPTVVLQFPKINASTQEQAFSHAMRTSTSLLESFSYFRDGSGESYFAVVIDLSTGNSTHFRKNNPYTGNIVGGVISGENIEHILSLNNALQRDSQLRYYVSQYHLAVAEKNPHYEYLKFYSILELMAESKNYDPSEDLLDFNSNPIIDNGGNTRKVYGSKNSVYRLLIDSGVNNTITFHEYPKSSEYLLYDYTSAWCEFRNATAHYGGFILNDPQQKKSFRGYKVCENSVNDQKGYLNAFILDQLKTCVRQVMSSEIMILEIKYKETFSGA